VIKENAMQSCEPNAKQDSSEYETDDCLSDVIDDDEDDVAGKRPFKNLFSDDDSDDDDDDEDSDAEDVENDNTTGVKSYLQENAKKSEEVIFNPNICIIYKWKSINLQHSIFTV
jgi:hypothetical protein